MSREIKFRVWDKENHKMIYYDEDCSAPDITLNGVLISHDKQSNVSYQYDLMQYTGQKDKNGKKVWDDTIMEDVQSKLYVIGQEQGGIGYVGRPILGRSGIVRLDTLLELTKFDAVVIGDIHQNPELLEKQ